MVSRLVKGIQVFITAAVLTWSIQAGAAASSCVTCHLDEDRLTDSLADVKAKASAKQSGAG